MWLLAFSLYAALNLVGTPTRRRLEDLALLEPDIEDAPDVSILVDVPPSIAINYDSNFVSSIFPAASPLYALVNFVSDDAPSSAGNRLSASNSSSEFFSVYNVSSQYKVPSEDCWYSQVAVCDFSPTLLSCLTKVSWIVVSATEQYHSLQSTLFWIVSYAIQQYCSLFPTSTGWLLTLSEDTSIKLVLLLYRFLAFSAVFGAFYRVRKSLRRKTADGGKDDHNGVGKGRSPGHHEIAPLLRSAGNSSAACHDPTSIKVRAVDVKGRLRRRSIGVQVAQYRDAATQTCWEDTNVGIEGGLVAEADVRRYAGNNIGGNEDNSGAPTQVNRKGNPNDITSTRTGHQSTSTSSRNSSDAFLSLPVYPFSRSHLAGAEPYCPGTSFGALFPVPPDTIAHRERDFAVLGKIGDGLLLHPSTAGQVVGHQCAPVTTTSGSTSSSEASLPLLEYLSSRSHSATVEPARTSFNVALPNVNVGVPNIVDQVVPSFVGHQDAVLKVAFFVKPLATSQCLAHLVPEANPLGDRPSLTSDGFKIICHAEACTGNAEVIRPCRHIKSSSNIYAVADPPSCVIQQPLSAGRATPAEVLDPPVREGDEDEEQEYATGVSQSVEYEEKFTVGIASYSPLDVQDPFIVVKKVLDVPVPNLGRRVWMTDVSATYSYEKLLGVGAYGAVSQYAVVGGDQRMPRVVAVKKMKYDDLAEKEVHLTKAMNWSEWVVMAFGGVVYKGEMFMVMDSCVGTLHDLNAEASSFPRDLAMFYIAETIVALRVLHRSRIIHRDVKPENMFITPSFHIAIGDFGIAHQFALPSEQDLLSSSEFSNWSTAYLEDQSRIQEDQLDLYTFPFLWAEDNPWTVNISCGTSVYAAPEVMRREYHSFGADLYSVGVITHLLLCGDFPYVDLANVEVYPGEPEFRVLQLDKSLTVIEKDFIARMLDPSTENRLSYKQIHDHRIFDKINWEAIELQTVIPPLQEYYKMLDDEHAE